ncbi:MAG: tRNA (adenosine(37)-N6)-threonylcarbamoyltransferase complex ATPase subunit type 1 TsaE [Acidimicrobiia bacterium]|nr:tRNA (adenosine(37)-N6)-threonylcarbamoyltransferase complex ATPase subunit type 1 TsaE [Acidimicrobiia bacterium]
MTRAIGAAIASRLECGDVIVLAGDLGAGKTVLAQGVAAGLGVSDPVVSPTFTIMREYEGRIRFNHLDVYRLDRLQEAIDLGLEELFADAVTLIEWGDGVRAVLPSDRLEISLALLPPDQAEDDARAVTLEAHGPRWIDRVAALAVDVAAAAAPGASSESGRS